MGEDTLLFLFYSSNILPLVFVEFVGNKMNSWNQSYTFLLWFSVSAFLGYLYFFIVFDVAYILKSTTVNGQSRKQLKNVTLSSEKLWGFFQDL